MTHEEIESLCLDRLRESFNPATSLFDRQLRRGAWGPTALLPRPPEGLPQEGSPARFVSCATLRNLDPKPGDHD
jgi:hypothetical protein